MWRIRRRQDSDFGEWIDRHHGALYRHALWMVGHPETAEDMVQETYYRAWRGRRGLRDPRRVLPWLLSILRRVVYREYRQRARGAELAEALGATDGDCQPDTQRELLDLHRALAALPVSQRETLLLHALHGFSYQEISDQLEVPVGTVMSRIARARKAVSAGLERDGAGGRVIELRPARGRSKGQ